MLRGHSFSVESAAFSPDGSRIVTASSDNTARIWDAATGKELAILGEKREFGGILLRHDRVRSLHMFRRCTHRHSSAQRHRARLGC